MTRTPWPTATRLSYGFYQAILPGGPLRVAYAETYVDEQDVDDQIKISVPVSNDLTGAAALRFTLTADGGSYPWKLLRYGA